MGTIYDSTSATQGSGAYNASPGHELEVMIIIFVVSDSWGFLRKISFSENIVW